MINNMKKSAVIVFCVFAACLLALTFCGCSKKSSGNSSSNSNSNSNTQKNNTQFSEKNFQQTDLVEIDIANYGKITVGLDANAAPITVANFKKLVGQGFYNGLTFHRIIADFMMQGGDPDGNGTGGSPETIKGEFSENGVNNTLAHTRGAISMARSQANDSASSQFFIVHKTSSNNSSALDGKYCCFGYVQSGMEIVDKVIADAKPTDNNGTIPAAQQPKITSITLK